MSSHNRYYGTRHMLHVQTTHQISICTYGKSCSIKSIHTLQQTARTVHSLVTVWLAPQGHLWSGLQNFSHLPTYTQGRCHSILIPSTQYRSTTCRNSRWTYLIISIDKYENPATSKVYCLVHGMINAGIWFTHQAGDEALPMRLMQIRHAAII